MRLSVVIYWFKETHRWRFVRRGFWFALEKEVSSIRAAVHLARSIVLTEHGIKIFTCDTQLELSFLRATFPASLSLATTALATHPCRRCLPSTTSYFVQSHFILSDHCTLLSLCYPRQVHRYHYQSSEEVICFNLDAPNLPSNDEVLFILTR
jgi:hypothetical protein